jgi:hypothetical protein
MSKLLISDIFHTFLLSEATITTFNTFTINGYIQKDFYSSEELEDSSLSHQTLSTWETIKPLCFDIIKGKKPPLSFKIIFMLSEKNVKKLLEQSGIGLTENDINGLFLNIKFSNNSLHCVTGTSLKVFTMDKSLETEWDSMVQKFFKVHEIPFELE